MFPILSDEELLDHDFSSLVIVEQSKKWPGQLVWQNEDQQHFVDTYHDYVSRHGHLNELFAIEPLVAQLEKDGYTVAFSDSTLGVQADYDRWNAPLHISGLDLRKYDGTPSQLWDYQRFSINRALDRITARHRYDRFFFFGWSAGTGKEQPVTEPVLTPMGWRTMGDLRVGDYVTGSNGHATQVIAIYPQGIKPVYRMTMNDGSFVRCGAEHLWNVRKGKIRNRPERGQSGEVIPWKTMTTEEILATTGPGLRRWQLPSLEPVEFVPGDVLSVDPYVLGVYLGDGNSGKAMMRVCTDRWIAEYLGWKIQPRGNRGIYTVTASVPLDTRRSLEALGLAGKRSWEKFVPEHYLSAPIADRRALLQGLLDTDGHPLRDGGIEYSTTSPHLRDTVTDLVRGLGGRVHISERAGHYTRSGVHHEARQNWRLHLNIVEEPFRLPRKLDAWTPPTKYQPTKTIVSIEAEGVSEEQVCIVVDAPDSLYVTRGHAVTHNSAACAAGALEALNRGEVDLVLAFTMRKLQLNLRDFFTAATPLKVAVCHGAKPRRAKLWADRDVAVYVNNFDKAHFDHDEIAARIAGKKVLFIFDEVEYLLTDGDARHHTRVRKATNDLMERCHSTAWPMSASVVDHSPLTYYDNYTLGSTSSATHPLGTRKDFEHRYLFERKSRTFENPHGRGYFTVHDETWDHVALQEVRHRVSHATQNARQTDPGVRENFPGISTIVIPIQLSDEDRRLYKIVAGWARAAFARGEAVGQHVELMRYICNHPGALGITRHPLAAELVAEHPKLITGAHSSKLEVFCDQVQQMAAAGEKVIAFTKWTDLCLHLVSGELARRGISFVEHHGGLTDAAAYDVVQRFKTDEHITLFWTSDVGMRGLSFQMARYVISYECPYSWRTLNQRMNRINRADGNLDGRVSYVYVTDDTVEVRIKARNDERRALAQATTGGREVDTWIPDKDDPDTHSEMQELIFGDN